MPTTTARRIPTTRSTRSAPRRRYLNAAGGDKDLRQGIFAYNHADWYVDEVLLGAQQYGKLPEGLISSITGLTEGAHFPVAADSRYADDLSEREVLDRAKDDPNSPYAAGANAIESSPTRSGINIYSHEGAPVVAVNDGVIKEIGESQQLGKYIVLQDAYGNEFTYAQLGSVSDVYPVPKDQKLTADDFQLVNPRHDEPPDQPATAGPGAASDDEAGSSSQPASSASDSGDNQLTNSEDLRDRLFAYPERPHNVDAASISGQLNQLLGDRFPGFETFKDYFSGVLHFDTDTMQLQPLEEGSKVVAGTVLGKIEKTDELAPHVHFMIRPAGKGARADRPEADPRRLEAARGDGDLPCARRQPVRLRRRQPGPAAVEVRAPAPRARRPAPLDLRLRAPGHPDGPDRPPRPRDDGIPAGARLPAHDHLAQVRPQLPDGVRQRQRALVGQRDGHRAGQRDPDHWATRARGSITEAVIRDLLMLQGPMEPHQIISLMDLGGPDVRAARS